MDENAIVAFFNQKYDEHKSRITGEYYFKFNQNLSMAGICRYPTGNRRGTIELSRVYVSAPSTTPEMIQKTILHEIAHAIAGHEAAHGPVWKAVCGEIGGDTNRCVKEFRPPNTYRYLIKCERGCEARRTSLGRRFKTTSVRCKRHREALKVYQMVRGGKYVHRPPGGVFC